MQQVLPIAYFPPISYFSLLARGEVLIEAHENYQKQSWRNRCLILTAGGVERLQVPIIHKNGTFRHPIREIEVDYSSNWPTRTKRAIDAAYMSSAYFEHYRERLWAILDSHPDTLWELNLSIIDFFLQAYGLPTSAQNGIRFTENFCEDGLVDIHPKHRDRVWEALSGDTFTTLGKPYFQVFGPKFGFVPNLSIMDFLFNEGPNIEF